MAPTSSEDAKAEQLRLAKELQRDFQKSGTFKGDSSGKGRSRSRASKPKPSSNNYHVNNHQPFRYHPVPQQAHHLSVFQPRNPNLGRSTSTYNSGSGFNNKRRKVDSEVAEFFAERPNSAYESGAVQYYQDHAATPTVTPSFSTTQTATQSSAPAMASSNGHGGHTTTTSPFSAPATTSNAGHSAPTTTSSQFSLIDTSIPDQQMMASTQPLQPTVAHSFATGQNNNNASVNTAPVLSNQAPITGPVIWHYQDNNARPEPLVRDENMMDVDMPNAGTERNHNLTVCTCTRRAPPGRGLGSSFWSADNMEVDPDCPYHGDNVTSKFKRNKNGYPGNDNNGGNDYNGAPAQGSSGNRFVGYY